MRILLPASAGKTAGTGPTLDLTALSYPELTDIRHTVVTAVSEAARRPDALDVFGVSARLGDEVAAMCDLAQARTAPAGHVMSGVLYQAAGYVSAPVADLAALDGAVTIVSDLFGFVAPADPIAAYRASMTTELAGLGKLGAHWRPHLRRLILDSPDPLVLSCCSAPYQAAWLPTRAALEKAGLTVLSVRPVVSTPEGLTSVSHWAKYYRGLLARDLGGQSRGIDTPEALMHALPAVGSGAIMDAFVETTGPLGTLTVVVTPPTSRQEHHRASRST